MCDLDLDLGIIGDLGVSQKHKMDFSSSKRGVPGHARSYTTKKERRKEGKKEGRKEARKQLGRKEGRKEGRKKRLKKGKIRTAITTDSK